MKYDVPFVEGPQDDLHCLQAAYMMIAKFFQPDFSIPMGKWSEVTGFEDGKATWESGGLLWFKNNGYEVRHISLFDYDDFIDEPEEYLVRLLGKEAGDWQIKNSNLPAEVERVQELMAAGINEYREPTLEDIKSYLDKGYLLRAVVNMQKLNGGTGYIGHSVTIIGYDKDGIILHDPGLPPVENRKETFADFEAAWASPNKESKELDAIRL